MNVYRIGPRAQDLLDGLRASRRRRACEVTLRRIGQRCVDNFTDGRVTEQDLRELDDTSRWRVFAGYLELLLQVGALVRSAGGYQVAYFHESNLPAKIQRARHEERRRLAVMRARRYRMNRPLCDTKKRAITAPCDERHAVLTVRGSGGDTYKNTGNNKSPGSDETKARNVPACQEVNSPEYDFVEAARRMAALRSAPPVRAPAANAVRFPPAKMPTKQNPVTEHHALQALQDLKQDPGKAGELFATLWRMRATDAEVNYGVFETRRQVTKQPISHPVRYMLAIIETQRAHRRAA